MMRAAWRVLALIGLVLAGLLILFAGFRWLPLARQRAIKACWSRLVLRLCGVGRVVRRDHAAPLLERPCLIVMNHVSWLDIFVLNAVAPSTFVAKSEIRRWPLLGWLVADAGTIFVERGQRHAVRRVNHDIRRRIARGEQIAFFPEGTTTTGESILPFHTSLFASALHESAHPVQVTQQLRVQPAIVRYRQHGAHSNIPAYVGNQTLVNSVWQILSAKGLTAELEFLRIIDELPAPVTRHALAAQAEAVILAALSRDRQRLPGSFA
jgi:1-acyl-sn-glycerol-3-phosphate acyltransferase